MLIKVSKQSPKLALFDATLSLRVSGHPAHQLEAVGIAVDMSAATNLSKLLRSIPRDVRDNAAYGDDFELVSDYALRHAAGYGEDIATIEPYKVWAVRNGHPAKDLGVDRVITTTTGELWTVQNKGYADNRRVSMGDFNNFVMHSQSIAGVTRRILVTSGPGLNTNASASSRTAEPVVVLNRTWLARATTYPDTWAEFQAQLGSPVLVAKAHQLRNHQQAAIHDVTASLRKFPAAQLLSACGTGKTVTSVGLANQLGAETVAYFVPTLGLMRQTIDAVRRQHVGHRRLLTVAVCSDNSVGSRSRITGSEEAVSEDDLGCEVFHTAEALADFVASHRRDGERLVIFCTYASAPVIVQAQHSHELPNVDLAFCDEAHNLVGTTGAGNTIGELVKHRDDKVPRLLARWRVYATATARSATARAHKAAASVGVTLDSMGEPSPVFGPVAHTFSFSEAIAAGILADYQVSVIATNGETYAEFVNSRTYVRMAGQGDVIDAGMFAALQALKEAYASGDRRIITYHHRVDEAAKFARLIDQDPALPGAIDVHGKLPAGERDDRLARLGNDGGYIITNAKCLTEGIDIPDLDGILFADPKSSPVEIAQCVGRVLRHASGKNRGHIIVPVAVASKSWTTGELTHDESRDLSQKDGPFRPVFEVLNALREHDEIIRHWLTELRLGVGHRRNKGALDVDEPDLISHTRDDSGDSHQDTEKPGEETPINARGEYQLLGDKVVLSAPYMSGPMLDGLSNALRLGLVTQSRSRHATTRDHTVHLMVENGWTVADAEALIDQYLAEDTHQVQPA